MATTLAPSASKGMRSAKTALLFPQSVVGSKSVFRCVHATAQQVKQLDHGRFQHPSTTATMQPRRPALQTHCSHSQRPTLPLYPSSAASSSASFSTSAALAKRRRYQPRDNNPLRGVSSIRRTGPREPLSVSNEPLPKPRTPALSEAAATVTAASVPVDPDHGLWQFFYENKMVAQPPAEDAAFGRAWTVEELRRKSWDNLHALWWVCVKERNRIATTSYARKYFDLGFGDYEAGERDAAVKQTMRGIKHVLTERFYSWEDAVELARTDPEIDLSGKGPAFQPGEYLEDAEDGAEAVPAAQKETAASQQQLEAAPR